ncbi:MAG: glycosyltransferase [Candidatus Bathyarchaeota archaeon]|nr:glycosyltransferase [Candidatus Bathyarchaeota archaeon]
MELVKHLEKYNVSSLIVCPELSVGDTERIPIQRIKATLDKVSAKYFEFKFLPLTVASSDSPIPLLGEFKKIVQVARDCDLIYFVHSGAFQDVLVYTLKKLRKKPVIGGQHCPIHFQWGKVHDLYVDTLGKSLLRKFDTCHVLNSYHLHLFNNWGLKNTYLIPIGVDIEKFKPKNFKRRQKKFKILFVGRLMPEKGVHTLCESIKIINNSKKLIQKNMEFIIVGSGPLESLAQKLVEQCKNVKYLGYLEETLPEIYHDCSLLIMPSHEEVFGAVAAEAQASGLPVIAFDCMGPRDILINGITGTLIRKRDAKMFAQKIIDYYFLWLNNYEKYKQMRLAARENAVKRFDWNIIAERIYNMLRETLKHTHGGVTAT